MPDVQQINDDNSIAMPFGGVGGPAKGGWGGNQKGKIKGKKTSGMILPGLLFN
jgi:hypothetical protein